MITMMFVPYSIWYNMCNNKKTCNIVMTCDMWSWVYIKQICNHKIYIRDLGLLIEESPCIVY